jgi:TetR/AcrR family transcriptional repressor of lmrAB and yxaGH operons
MAQDTRQQMIETAARMLQRDGYHATTWRGVVEESSMPWGSIAHHFPGGKEELALAALQTSSDAVAALIEQCLDEAPEAADGIARWLTKSAELLEKGRYQAGCPLATVTLETAPLSDSLTAASRSAFSRWERIVADRLRRAGASKASAEAAAEGILALLEGGLILARVRGSARPMKTAAKHARAIASAATA